MAVRGGGHSTAGTSSTDGGLLFDLSGMRKVRVDAEKRLIYAQGGCLWSHVDDAAWEHRLATVGGTVADTGIGGLTLGGGYGHLTGKYGLVSDCVEEIEVVLANGDIVRANEQCHPDLFWGLLGAGQNFGVCTEFVYRAFPQGDMFLGHLQYPATPDVVAKVIDALNDLYVVRNDDTGHFTNARGRSDSEMCIVRDPDSGKPMLDIMTCINDTASQGRELYKALYDIGPVADTMSTKSYPASNAMHDVLAGSRNSMKGAGFTLPMRAEFVNECVAEFVAFTSANPDAADGSCIAWCIHDPVQLASSDRGSFANRGWHHSSVALLSWTMTENDEACRGWGRKVGAMFKAELERSGEAGGTVTSGDSAVGRRGPKGALMMYGNYDVSLPTSVLRIGTYTQMTFVLTSCRTAIWRKGKRPLWRTLRAVAADQGSI